MLYTLYLLHNDHRTHNISICVKYDFLVAILELYIQQLGLFIYYN